MYDQPNDTLCEIFLKCDLAEIRELSKVNKQFNQICMMRNSGEINITLCLLFFP